MNSEVILVAIPILLVLLAWTYLRKVGYAAAQERLAPISQDKKQIYLDLRDNMLHISSDKVKSLPSGPTDPLAILMDVPGTKAVGTIVAVADGSVSLYLSNGGGLLGGDGNESIRRAGKQMFDAARKIQPMMHATKDYPLPIPGQINLYLVTNSGALTITGSELDQLGLDRLRSDITFAGYQILAEYNRIRDRG